jgi:hypothetical protein
MRDEKLKIYAEQDGKLLVGIKGRYLCKPRWYKLRYTKGEDPKEFVLWKGRRNYTDEMEIAPEFIDQMEAERQAREVKTA